MRQSRTSGSAGAAGEQSPATTRPIRHTERRREAGIESSVGRVRDSYDNALAESVIGLFKTGVIRRPGPRKRLEDLEFATLERVDWFNHRRLPRTPGRPSTGRVRGPLSPASGGSGRSGLPHSKLPPGNPGWVNQNFVPVSTEPGVEDI